MGIRYRDGTEFNADKTMSGDIGWFGVEILQEVFHALGVLSVWDFA